MIAPYISPTKLTAFEMAVTQQPRQHLLLFLDLSKHDRACVAKLFAAGHNFDTCLWIVLTVPDAQIDYTPINAFKKDSL
ncbi:hypothetical protein LCGC14_1345660 [marine sediment metagenome]|uniref:Uncharacterized protein n=1 Tax=marine sediment metagenome TaxID=412755 RepID=A0A0F9KD19_9ZZZZ